MAVGNLTCCVFLVIIASINPVNYSILCLEIRPQNCTIFVPYMLCMTLKKNILLWMLACKRCSKYCHGFIVKENVLSTIVNISMKTL